MHYEQAPFSRPNHLSNSSPVGVASLYVVAVAMMESHEYTLRPAGAPSRVGIAAFLLGLFVLSKVKGESPFIRPLSLWSIGNWNVSSG